MRARITFIVVNFNGGELLQQCLESIKTQTVSDWAVLVIDNGSTDDSTNLAHFGDNRFTLIKNGQNMGFARANNQALAKATGSLIALINNDIILDTHWAERMAAALDEHDGAGSAACRILRKDNPDLLDSAGFEYFSCGTTSCWNNCPIEIFADGAHAPFGAVASAAMYRKSAIEKAGLFHDEYFCYYEDTDLAVRLRLHGFDTTYVADAIAYHHGSFTGKERSDFHIFHLRRNIEYLYWIDMAGSLAWSFLLPHVTYECLAFLGALFSGQGTTFLKAKLDFLRHLPWILRERRGLKDRLLSAGRLPAAKKELCKCMSPWPQAFARTGNLRKFARVKPTS
ncbi:MAG: glycosyltransferase family 2 protein [Lentisphaerae bacterium]|nr:glycosyltransferase family 2 protein [Lentisphaerota bacterium]